eukprot:jgi/Chlat1/932/Chrsp108S01365
MPRYMSLYEKVFGVSAAAKVGPAAEAEAAPVAQAQQQKQEMVTATADEAPSTAPSLGLVRDYPVQEDYEFGAVIGKGNFGVVRTARHIITGQLHAVKAIPKVSGQEYAKVLHEAEIMRALSKGACQGVVQVYGVYQDNEHVYLAMELLHGGELRQRLVRRRQFSEKEAARLVKSILQLVQECHACGVMHRDIKPENFVFARADADLPLKAIDFGLAAFFSEGVKLTKCSGTPYYMAPEVIRGSYGAEADLWSVGVMLYEMIAGVKPFVEDKRSRVPIVDVMYKVVHQPIDFESVSWRFTSLAAKDFVLRLLDRNSDTRMTSAQALQHPWLLKNCC